MRTQHKPAHAPTGDTFGLPHPTTDIADCSPHCVRCVLSPWIGTCVGAANYRSFSLFVHALHVLVLYVLAFCVLDMVYVVREKRGAGHPTLDSAFAAMLSRNPVAFLLALYCVLAAAFVSGLSCYHVWLTSVNQTTNEHLKQAFPDTSPWSKGCLGNWAEMCGGRRQLEQWRRRQPLHGQPEPSGRCGEVAAVSPRPVPSAVVAPYTVSVLVQPVPPSKARTEDEEQKEIAPQAVASSAIIATSNQSIR